MTTQARIALFNKILTATLEGLIEWRPHLRGWSTSFGVFAVCVDGATSAITVTLDDYQLCDLGAGVNGSYKLADAIRKQTNDAATREAAFARFVTAVERGCRRDDGRDSGRGRPAAIKATAKPA